MVKDNLAKGVESALDMFPILLTIHHFLTPFLPKQGAKYQTPTQHKTAWAFGTGTIRDNYMTCVFILIGAKSHASARAFLTAGYEKKDNEIQTY